MEKEQNLRSQKLGWIGTGRMGYAMANKLLEAGCDTSVYNRTRSKAEPLETLGARIVDTPAELSDRDIIFTMVSGSDDLFSVICGDHGVLAGSATPKLLIDCSSVSEEGSQRVRDALKERGCSMLSAPVSGNAKVIKAGRLTVVASGPQSAFDLAEKYLEVIGEGVTYVGKGELARMVKICHNVLGVSRHALLDFINNSVMGSMFTRYKSPAFVNLDWTPTFTPPLLRKDMDLGLSAAERLGASMPIAAATRELVQQAIDAGHTDCDFGILLELQAEASGLHLQTENIEVDDGLS